MYFYGAIGVAASLAFFNSPGKRVLIKRLDKRNHPHVRKTLSQETQHPPALGLPNDPGREIDEAIEEIKQEVDRRQRQGSTITMPRGDDLRKLVEEKVDFRVRQTTDGKVAASVTAGSVDEQTKGAQTKKEL